MSTKPISITLPTELLFQIEEQVASGQFASVSEFVRHCVRLALKTPEDKQGAERDSNKGAAAIPNQVDDQLRISHRDNWVVGKVQRGQQLGGKLGFPTINLDPSLLPATVAYGVYAAEVEHEDKIYVAAAHFGPRKTLGEWKPTLEFHLLDFDQHIPGSLVRFRLLEQIRTTLRFDSLRALKTQLALDVAQVRQIWSSRKGQL